jgi:hypothetical protein
MSEDAVEKMKSSRRVFRRHRRLVKPVSGDGGKPIGVARYVTKLVESLPEELAGVLPSIEQIEAELAKG